MYIGVSNVESSKNEGVFVFLNSIFKVSVQSKEYFTIFLLLEIITLLSGSSPSVLSPVVFSIAFYIFRKIMANIIDQILKEEI